MGIQSDFNKFFKQNIKGSGGTDFASSPLAMLGSFRDVNLVGQQAFRNLLDIAGGKISTSAADAFRSSISAESQRFRARTGSRAGSLAANAASGLFATRGAAALSQFRAQELIARTKLGLSLQPRRVPGRGKGVRGQGQIGGGRWRNPNAITRRGTTAATGMGVGTMRIT